MQTESARIVLLVEDHSASAEMMSELLTFEGYTVAVASSGAGAIAIARARMPAVALLDIGLPDMSGFALAGLFKADEALRHVRLVALSGYGQPQDATGGGAFERYLVKPVDIDELLALLHELGSSTPNP